MAEERDERLYLADIRDSVEKILRYTSGGRDEFFADPMRPDGSSRRTSPLVEVR